jgi:GNAT superfamily N-acetyltransferase
MGEPAHRTPLFAGKGFRACEIETGDLPMLQRFFEANPEYHRLVTGQPPAADAAHEIFVGVPPDWMPYARKWLLGLFDEAGALLGLADIITDLLAPGVWHLGLFVVATPLHGTGMAMACYGRLESWMRDQGARWLRLGVVMGNARAERFWERAGYVDTRLRHGVEMGERINTLRVMMKPLAGGSLSEYLSLVARDRPEEA